MATFDQIANLNKIATLEQMLLSAKPGGLKEKVLTNQISNLKATIPRKVVINKKPATTETKLSKNDVVFLGKTYKIGKNEKYKSIVQVAKELKVDTKDLKKYRDDQDKKRVFIKGNESIEIDLTKKKPLLLREFGVSRISNQQLIKKTNTIKRKGETLKIFEDVPDNINLTVFIEAYVWILFSNQWIERKISFQTVVQKGDDINKLILDKSTKYFSGVSLNEIKTEYDAIQTGLVAPVRPDFTDGVKITRNNKGGQTMRLENMILRDDMPPSIKNMYSNIIEDRKWKHCIHDYMAEIYKKNFGRKTLEKLNTTDDIYNFCVAKNIKMIAYDINGNCIKSNYTVGERKGVKNLFFIAYNNHLYPIKSQYLDKVKPIITNIEFIQDSNAKIIEILEAGRYVSNINLFGSEIVSFVDDGIKYICNNEYIKCKEILEKFGLADKIYDGIRITGLGKLIKDLYITESDKSIFIGHERFVKGGFNYTNDTLEGEFKTIDANKFYPSCLKDLNFLITVDMAKNDLEEYEDGELKLDEDHYLYIAKPDDSSILIPDTNCYSGEFLKYCKNEGIKFTILEKMKTNRISNHYTQFLNDLYIKVGDKLFKEIMNPFIGQFENSTSKFINYFNKFVNNDELNTVEDTRYIHNITNNLHMVCDIEHKINIYNRKPIAIQLKDESRKRLYEMMKVLKLNDSNIKAIKTDAITYLSDSIIPKRMIGRDLGLWKYIENKEVKATFNYTDDYLSFIDGKAWVSNNIIGNCYAGCGKSYKIINEHIPNIGGSYIVLTPSHSSLKEYRSKNLNCDVIQSYEFSHNVPTEQTIIIDELGMVGRRGMHLILEWFHLGKHIISYGDFNQLLPIGEDFSLDSSVFVNSIYYNIVKMETNYRNNFTKEFYDNIINGKLDNEDIIKKYRNVNSNNVICFRNKTCDKYNRIVADRLGIRDKFAVGAKIICNTNKLRELKIYNKFCFTVIEEADEYIIVDGNIKIMKKIMDKMEGEKEYFTFSYARTLHSVQGESLPDLYFPDEDLDMIKDNNRFCYTLISRLKGTFPIY